MSAAARTLQSLADGVLLPGFHGSVAPDWFRRRISDSLGGVCLFATNVIDVEQVRVLTDSLRSERPDVVVAVDEEGGAVTRLDAAEGSRFPGAAALGRVDDIGLTERIGAAVGRLTAAAGITLNFAPCADVLTDPANPVIRIRSFGTAPELVARHTAAFVRGHQAQGVAACVKHYPGHGNTDVDTHLGQAVVHQNLESLRHSALLPFAAGVAAGVASVMAGHLLVPEVDALPASVSGRWLVDILRGEMGFTGVVVTDALDMAAIARRYGLVEGAVMAVEAGADLLCLGAADTTPEVLDHISSALVAAVGTGRIDEERLVRAATRAAGLGVLPPPVSPARLAEDRRIADQAARRALATVGSLPPLMPGLLVVRCEAGRNFAVGSVPWGPMAVMPPSFGAIEVVVTHDAPVPLELLPAAPQVLVVTSDRHRHDWMRAAVALVRSIRPDAVLVEMGTGGVSDADAPALASYGSGPANARAVLDRLVGGPGGAVGSAGAHTPVQRQSAMDGSSSPCSRV
ncbi:beta-N-acetylhexosaminidase [Nakamurella panacisegetis]|uniref:Beta-N-acetylhexosaminidase n=2 Tax=Nakamurella panacisegetis TaxID=1090615 RepID=A0A1H0LTX3_9ACTN|nr:beta-N-acetylhexosaminidase [Nakamurella panacisegetis]